VQSVLLETSRVLESLQNVSGVHSFFLAVDPSDPGDQGFLGGTVVGREFWRGLRRGGDMGFKSFKVHCLSGTQATYREDDSATATIPTTTTTTLISSIGQRSPARAKKSEAYTNVRHALRFLIISHFRCLLHLFSLTFFIYWRTASGVRNAEMKWTNHDRLSIYGVRVVGWPESVPHQNPSSLTTSQNNLILESLKNGNLQFIRRAEWDEPSVIPVNPVGSEGRSLSGDATSDMSWACEDGVIDVVDL
jgi:hypothetical protein